MTLKVKDLTAELGMSLKDMLHLLRDLGVSAKSSISSLEEADVQRVRDHVRQAARAASAVTRTQIQPGVVVRRRRTVDAPDSAGAPEAAEAGAAAQVETSVASEATAGQTDQTGQAAQGALGDRREARIISRPGGRPGRPGQPTGEETEQDLRPKGREVSDLPTLTEDDFLARTEPEAPESATTAEEAPAAASVAEAFAESEAATEPKAPAETSGVAPSEAPTAASGEAPAAASGEASTQEVAATSEPQALGQTSGASQDATRPAPPRKGPAAGSTAPQVKIISRPTAPVTPPARPAQDRGPGGPGGYAPRGPGGPGGYAPRGPGGPGGYAPRGPGGPGGYAPRGPGGPGGYAPRGPGGPGGAPGAPGAPMTPEQAAEAERRRAAGAAGKKDKRVVEFVGGGEAARKAAAAAIKRKKTAELNDRTGRIKGGPRKRRPEEMSKSAAAAAPTKAEKRKVRVEDAIRVSDLAHQMGVKAQELIKILFNLGVMATINQAIDFDTAQVIAGEFGFQVERSGFSEEDALAVPETEEAPENMKPRPPVVTIMGHVDHGKTSLLDAIRKTSVVLSEAGGITQHIGAYHVTTPNGDVTFLDTPGHEAFTAMRARGAQVTDVVILVVAADDGVMDQTREAVSHSKAAGVPIVVAVNKIDKEGANPDRVKRELAELGLSPEEWGGDTIFVNVSAKQRLNLDQLLELVALQTEVLDLKANPDKPARGHIVEAKLDKGRGAVATVLVQEGSLKQGDAFVCGVRYGKVRAMFNDLGKKVKAAGPSMPVEVQGFDGVPEAGDEFIVLEDEKLARRIADQRAMKLRERELAKETKVTLESFMAQKKGEEAQTLNLVLKADVQGSLEAIADALRKLPVEQVKINLIHTQVGGITESDVMLAAASQAIILGFNVRPIAKVKELAEREKVDIRFYDIIYNVVNEIKEAMTGMLAPVVSESYLGQAEVRQTFSVPKVGVIAGCGVTDGKLVRAARVRLLRDGVVIYTGKLSSLKRFKEDAKEVAKGYECGAGLENFNDLKVGDIIEAFEMVESKAVLDQ